MEKKNKPDLLSASDQLHRSAKIPCTRFHEALPVVLIDPLFFFRLCFFDTRFSPRRRELTPGRSKATFAGGTLCYAIYVALHFRDIGCTVGSSGNCIQISSCMLERNQKAPARNNVPVRSPRAVKYGMAELSGSILCRHMA